jgi:hypothetical protein
VTDDADLQPAVAAEFEALADLLDSARRSPDDTIRIIVDDLAVGGVHENFGEGTPL